MSALGYFHIAYFPSNKVGGWVTYVEHLILLLEQLGYEPILHTLAKNTAAKSRKWRISKPTQKPIMRYPTNERDLRYIVNKYPGRFFIAASYKNSKDLCTTLLRDGAGIIIHDPTEIQYLDKDLLNTPKTIISKSPMRELLPKATFIRLPWEPFYQPDFKHRTRLAVAMSRIDFDKHTNLILDANRLLEKHQQVDIFGFENRIYTHFNIKDSHPEFIQSLPERLIKEPFYELLMSAWFSVDMSVNRPGGTGDPQYTTLEAWSAGVVPIVNTRWIVPGAEVVPFENCVPASDGQMIANLLSKWSYNNEDHVKWYKKLVKAGYETMQQYRYKHVAPKYEEYLNV